MTEGADNEDELAVLRRRVNDIEDYSKQFLISQIEQRDERIDDLEDRLDRIEGLYLDVQDELDGLVGLSEGERSTPDKRAFDLYATLIRRAKTRNAKGFVMWWREAYDALCDLGHEDLQGKTDDQAKPLIHNAMDRAVDEYEAVSFTKTPAITEDGAKRDVKAVRVKLDKLPSGASVKEFTTVGGGSAPTDQNNPTAIQQPNSD